MWGRQFNEDGQPVDGEIIPKKGEELIGTIKISLFQGEFFNMNRSKFWKVSQESRFDYICRVAFSGDIF